MMNARLSALLGLALLATAGCAPVATPSAQTVALDARIARFVDEAVLPGAVVLTARNGRVEHLAAFGSQDVADGAPMAPDTLFRIFSMTKPITAAAVMMLVDDGKVSLDEPVETYLPEFRANTVYSPDGPVPARPMTVAQLISHTSGLSYSFQPTSPVAAQYTAAGLAGGAWFHDPRIHGLSDFTARLAPIPLAFQPGERWHYSMGTDVAGALVERVSGLSFADFLQRRLFDPLGMKDTGFQVAPGQASRLATLYVRGAAGRMVATETGAASVFLQPPSAFSGGGGLISTAQDYYLFGQMLLNGGELNGRRVLSRRSVEAMTTNHLPASMGDAPLGEAAAFGYGATADGLGFGYGGAVVVDPTANGGYGSAGEYGWGGAANTLFWIDPKEQRVVVFMTQLLPSGALPLRDTLKQLVYAPADH